MSISIVTRKLKRTRKTVSDLCARGVGLLLVLFIFYGTTIEAAHRHSQTPASDATTSSLSSPQTSSLKIAKANCNDCLICQLHQNFSSTLITARATAPPKLLRANFFTALEKDFLSQISSPRSDRAPPFTF